MCVLSSPLAIVSRSEKKRVSRRGTTPPALHAPEDAINLRRKFSRGKTSGRDRLVCILVHRVFAETKFGLGSHLFFFDPEPPSPLDLLVCIEKAELLNCTPRTRERPPLWSFVRYPDGRERDVQRTHRHLDNIEGEGSERICTPPCCVTGRVAALVVSIVVCPLLVFLTATEQQKILSASRAHCCCATRRHTPRAG